MSTVSSLHGPSPVLSPCSPADTGLSLGGALASLPREHAAPLYGKQMQVLAYMGPDDVAFWKENKASIRGSQGRLWHKSALREEHRGRVGAPRG